jgi:hydrogenase nickel incorporation protein HypB
MKSPVIETRFHDANPVAKLNRQALAEAGVFAITLSGGAGCGKTSLIEVTINLLTPGVRAGVIACDVASHRDADRISRVSGQVVQVNTGKQGMPDATYIRDALRWLDLDKIDLLIIENVGDLLGRSQLDLGQDAAAAMFSVAAGHDKPDKHPELAGAADVVILSKTDLLSAIPFDLAAFRADVGRLNPGSDLIELSSLNGQGVDRWLDWLKIRIKAHREAKSSKCQ